jgi:hypothetical protein
MSHRQRQTICIDAYRFRTDERQTIRTDFPSRLAPTIVSRIAPTA